MESFNNYCLDTINTYCSAHEVNPTALDNVMVVVIPLRMNEFDALFQAILKKNTDTRDFFHKCDILYVKTTIRCSNYTS